MERPLWRFITGRAGTGKSFLMKQHCEEDLAAVLCATTGIAAMNLGEGVVTINSLLKYYDTASLQDLYLTGRLGANLRLLARAGIRTIILDEVSMLEGEQLTILCQALDEYNDRAQAISDAEEEAGDGDGDSMQMGLWLTGDFCQLPPVQGKFAFEVPEWKRFGEATTRLEEIRRQADPGFIEALQWTRMGDPRKALEFFEPLLKEGLDDSYDGTMIFSKNVEVDRYNGLQMSRLSGELHTFLSDRWGKERSEWKQVPEQLELREGALVMVLANEKDRGPDGKKLASYRYVNGDLGVLERVQDGFPYVRLKRGDRLEYVNRVTRKNTVPLEPGRRKELKAAGKGYLLTCNQNCLEEWKGEPCLRPKFETIGEVTYVPLRAAWASTCHKSQGLSLDRVQVDYRGHFFGSPGMLYVALSRARDAGGLRLVGRKETFVARCQVDGRVREWL